MIDIKYLKAEFAKFIASQTKESMEEWIAFDKKRTAEAELKDNNDTDDYVSLNDIDVFAEPMKVKRKKIKFKKITYSPKINLGIDLNDL